MQQKTGVLRDGVAPIASAEARGRRGASADRRETSASGPLSPRARAAIVAGRRTEEGS